MCIMDGRRKYNSKSIRVLNEDFKWIDTHRNDGESNGDVVARLIRNYDEARQLKFEKEQQEYIKDYKRCFDEMINKRLEEKDVNLFNMLTDKQKRLLETLFQESGFE